MELNVRVIGKIGFLLIIIGFFMPIACDQNAFQLIDRGNLMPIGVFAIITAFICAVIGLLFGVLLIINKNVPLIFDGFDWLITISCFYCIVGPFCYAGFKQGHIDYFQSGAYLTLIGSTISFLSFIVVAIITFSSNADRSSENIRKCPFCANEVKIEAILCQYCGKNLPKLKRSMEIVKNIIPSIKEIPTFGQVCTVIRETAIKELRRHNSYVEKELNVGDIVYFQKIKNNDPEWYYVKSMDSNIKGWCFSGYLEKSKNA